MYFTLYASPCLPFFLPHSLFLTLFLPHALSLHFYFIFSHSLSLPLSLYLSLVSAEKGHDNPIGMCASVLDLALGFLEEENENGNENEKMENSDNTRMTSGKSPVPAPTPLKAHTNKTSLFEILRNRIEDEKPLVRVKAIQIFGTALSLNYPKRVNKNKNGSIDNDDDADFQIEELGSQADHFGINLFP
jgi:hypothetical protein